MEENRVSQVRCNMYLVLCPNCSMRAIDRLVPGGGAVTVTNEAVDRR